MTLCIRLLILSTCRTDPLWAILLFFLTLASCDHNVFLIYVETIKLKQRIKTFNRLSFSLAPHPLRVLFMLLIIWFAFNKLRTNISLQFIVSSDLICLYLIEKITFKIYIRKFWIHFQINILKFHFSISQ